MKVLTLRWTWALAVVVLLAGCSGPTGPGDVGAAFEIITPAPGVRCVSTVTGGGYSGGLDCDWPDK